MRVKSDTRPLGSRRLFIWVLALWGSLGGALVAVVPAQGAAKHHPPPVTAVGTPAPLTMNSATGVSCGDRRHCWVVGLAVGATAAIVGTANGGATWNAETAPPSVTALAVVSCVGKLTCLGVGASAAGGAAISTVNGGLTWTVAQNPAGAAAVTAVQCTSKVSCVALATDGASYWSVTTTDLGATWSRGGTLPAGLTAVGLTCPSPSSCLAAGYSPTGPGQAGGTIATTANAGQTWTAATLPHGVGLLRSIACAGAACLAVGTSSTATTGFVPGGGTLLTSPDGGTTWQMDNAAVGGDDAFAAACPNPKTCIAVGTDWIGKAPPDPTASIVATLDGGLQWRPARLRYVPVGLASVSCPAVNVCVAVGGNVLVRVSLPVTAPAPKRGPSHGQRAGSGVR